MPLKKNNYILTVPSYIIPGSYLENIKYLQAISEIKAVELLFFYFNEETENLFLKEKDEIKKYRDRFFFTVHMPDLIEPGHETILKMTSGFVSHYIIHPPESEKLTEFVSLIKKWSRKYNAVFALENIIERDWQPVMMKTEISLCIDTGHLLLNNQDPLIILNKYNKKIREIHLHGLSENRTRQNKGSLTDAGRVTENRLADHYPFTGKEVWFNAIIPFLKTYNGFLNIEVFNEPNLKLSLECLKNI